MRRLLLALALSLVAALTIGTAHAHGGLPISQAILLRDQKLIVPTKYWGVFFGSDGGPWRWICEEAINKKQDRLWALQGDGTWHVTDYQGLESSRDGGCTWVPATGEIATRAVSIVIADPADGKRAWATTTSGAMDAPSNALYTSSDGGVSWTPVLALDEYLRGAALSPDGQTIYVLGSPRNSASGDGGAPPDLAGSGVTQLLHRSDDAGKSWSVVRLDYQLDGATPSQMVPIAVDPTDRGTLYLRAQSSAAATLVRASAGGSTVAEVIRTDGAIGDLTFEGATAWAAVKPAMPASGTHGVYRSDSRGPFQPVGNLSQAQCVREVGAALYACSWNYAPDLAAIARSDDGGGSFHKIFQYDQTVGPTTDCAPSTPVGSICPQVWSMYATQLGIGGGGDMDGGSDGGGGGKGGGCSCAAGGQEGGAGATTLAALAILWFLRRRR